MISNFDNQLKKILSDKTSGSTELLQKLNHLIKSKISGKSGKYDKDKIRIIINRAQNNFSEFEIISSYLNKIQNSFEDREKLLEIVNSFEMDSNSSFKRIYKNAKPYLRNKKTILTISNSKTILEVFKLWKKDKNNLRVIVCESRPKMEGKLLAKKLIKNNVKAQLIVDALMENFISKCDAVIIGADKILANKNVINKIGSKTAAILCKRYKKPFYVIASKEKFSRTNKFFKKREPSKEVWNFENKNLEITNIYFEEIESSLITKIISD